MHAAMTPNDIEEKLSCAFQQATMLKASYENKNLQDGSLRKAETNLEAQASNLVSPLLTTTDEPSRSALFHHMKYPFLSQMYSTHSVTEISHPNSSSDTSDSDDLDLELPHSAQFHVIDADLEFDLPRPCSIISPPRPAASSKKPPGQSALCPTSAVQMPFVTVIEHCA